MTGGAVSRGGVCYKGRKRITVAATARLLSLFRTGALGIYDTFRMFCCLPGCCYGIFFSGALEWESHLT